MRTHSKDFAVLSAVLGVALGGTLSAQPFQLNQDPVDDGDVHFRRGVVFSPDYSWLAYLGDLQQNEVVQIFLRQMPEDLSVARENEDEWPGKVIPLVRDDRVAQLEITPDNRRLVGIIDHNEGLEGYIYSVVPDWTGDARELEPEIVVLPSRAADAEEGEEARRPVIDNFILTPDSRFAIMRATTDVRAVPTELWEVDLETSTPRVISPEMVQGGNVGPGMKLSPNGQYVVYVADARRDEQFELFSYNRQSGETVRLSPDLPERGQVLNSRILLSPDGSKVLFLANARADTQTELFMVPITGGQATVLNPDLSMEGDVVGSGLRFTPDGQMVVFLADAEVNDRYDIHVADLAGGSTSRLFTVDAPNKLSTADITMNPEGTELLAYVKQPRLARAPMEPQVWEEAEQSWDYVERMIWKTSNVRVPIDGSAPIAVQANWDMEIEFSGPTFIPGTDDLIVLSQEVEPVSEEEREAANNEDHDGESEDLMHKPRRPASLLIQDGASPALALTPLHHNVMSWHFLPGEQQIVYLAQDFSTQEEDGEDVPEEGADKQSDRYGNYPVNLYALQARRGSTPVMLNAPLPPGGTVYAVYPTNDPDIVLYTATQDDDKSVELYAVSVSEATARANGTQTAAGARSDQVAEGQ